MEINIRKKNLRQVGYSPEVVEQIAPAERIEF
jgi:hypothetical protein